MVLLFRSAFLAIATILLASNTIQAQTANRDIVVDSLKEKVSELKETVEHGADTERDFAIEQAEFDRMREELLAAEAAILLETAETAPAKESEDTIVEESTVATAETNKSDPKGSIAYASSPAPKPQDNIKPVGSTPIIRDPDSARAAIRESNDQFEKLKSENETVRAKLGTKEKELEVIRTALRSAESEAKSARSKITSLQKELQLIKNKLLVSEAEVERLSTIAGSGSRNARLPAPAVDRAVYTTKGGKSDKSSTTTDTSARAPVRDLSVVTVTANKAYLRTGPGKDNSPLMEVKSGTRLAVEDRQGEWFRVTTPTGTRAWIATEVVAFGPSNGSPSQTVKIRAYEDSQGDEVEDKAFELINRHSR